MTHEQNCSLNLFRSQVAPVHPLAGVQRRPVQRKQPETAFSFVKTQA